MIGLTDTNITFMKKNTFLILFLTGIMLAGMAQQPSFSNQSTDPAVQRDARTSSMDFVQGEILVKFRDEVAVSTGNNLKSSGINSVDRILKANGGTSLVKLFPAEKRLKSVQIVKDPQGRDMKIPSLHNIYKITLPNLKSSGSMPSDIFKFIDEMKALPEVEYAEPNYIFSIGDFTPDGPEMSLAEAIKQAVNTEFSSTASGLVPNDPLYNSQWGIPATNIDEVWNTTTGDSTSIIAILDTGVDWLHPDLAANIYTNKQEIPGNGQDDDGNGKIDDSRGWDFINNDNNPTDDNSHGTHCAGIAAAVGNNGIGIAGVNWKAKIMPVKVFQSSGRGDAATIAQGVTYAASMGATVISMSFGSYAESLTLKTALENAYATAVLVAAAGNDAIKIGPCSGCSPMYPGAYSFVLGVEANASNGSAGFTNFDQDGPVFSQYSDLLNYELKAPGSEILSCVPGGNYRVYSGTSMATPLVAGAVSLYRKQKPTESQELLFGNFINSINLHIDLEKALTIIPEPKLNIVSYQVSDTIDGDRDGRPDAGETIELKVKVRNTWGQANDVKVSVEFGEFEDHSTATIQTAEASIGSISAYASRENTISLKIKLAPTINDGRDIVFKLKTWYGNHLGETNQPITLMIENGVELSGIISSNLTLYPDRQYFVSENLIVGEGVTLTIKPGTIIKLAENKSIVTAGKIIALGKPDSLIVFTKRNSSNSWNDLKVSSTGKLTMDYCNVSYGGSYNNYSSKLVDVDWASAMNDRYSQIKNTLFDNNFGYIKGVNSVSVSKCVFNNNNPAYGCFYSLSSQDSISYSIITANYNYNVQAFAGAIAALFDDPVMTHNNIFNNYSGDLEINYSTFKSTFSIIKFLPNYFGTSNTNKINKTIYDFEEDASKPLYDISAKLDIPPKEAHGMVWKVVVNGKDAQDQYDQLDPLGVGKQKFDVYFNRPMDINYPPSVSMGVRYPFTQTALAENGSWNADSTIYTVYGTVKLTTGDGINTIRVIGAKDNDHFEIPEEYRRFKAVVSTTGSASNEFMATAGLGKVSLEWNNADLEDGLGYNMYRMKQVNDTTLSTPQMVNTTLIADTLYTDFEVSPNEKYFYYYKIVRTNLSETDSSKIVSAIPFTANKGDANGDLAVNVLDVTSIVSYLLGQNPQPFIFEAADVNTDNVINILDIIGTVNKIISGGKKSMAGSANIPPAYIYLDKNEIFFKTQYPVSALQFELEGSGIDKITLSSKQKGFELVYNLKDGKITGILFSFDNKSLPTEITGIIDIHGESSGLKWGNLLGGDANGNAVKVIPDELHSYSLADCSLSAFPNPFSQSTTISYHLYEAAHVQLEVYDIYGRLVEILLSADLSEGEFQQIWKGTNSNGSSCNQGFYFCRLMAKSVAGKTISKTTKLLRIGQ